MPNLAATEASRSRQAVWWTRALLTLALLASAWRFEWSGPRETVEGRVLERSTTLAPPKEASSTNPPRPQLSLPEEATRTRIRAEGESFWWAGDHGRVGDRVNVDVTRGRITGMMHVVRVW